MNYQEQVNIYLKAKHAYYSGCPIMSDTQFDELEDEIRKANPDEPALKQVGTSVFKSDSAKTKHQIHMGSQDKVHTFEELSNWKKNRHDTDCFHVSYKADGGSLALYYKKGKLVSGVTRGDGIEGEDISIQAGNFKGVPLQLPYEIDVAIRCEAVTTLKDWVIVDPLQSSNPRAIANGILGRDDSSKSRYITAKAFDIDFLSESDKDQFRLTSVSAQMAFLELLGFETVVGKGLLTLVEVQEFYNEVKVIRDNDELPFWIDGVVIKFENIEIQQYLGINNDKKPKYSVAWKFPAEKSISTLNSIEWQVGHTGAICPVAMIEPVRIGGSTVKKASLANADNIKTLGAFIGAKIEVVKAGDIIPQIVAVVSKFDPSIHSPIEIPSVCPVCGHPLGYHTNTNGNDSVALFCDNIECDAKVSGRIKRFVGSRNILGLGDSIINALVNNEFVLTVPDLYKIVPKEIENMLMDGEGRVRLGLTRATNICEEIQLKGREMSLPEFLGAFGTRALGVRKATLMIEGNSELKNLENWFNGSLCDPEFARKAGVPNVGKTIFESLKEQESILLETLQYITITTKQKTKIMKTGMSICITGKLPSGKKKHEYEEPLANAGHQLIDGFTKDVDILVVSDLNGAPSSKTKNAIKWGVKMIDESGLNELITEG